MVGNILNTVAMLVGFTKNHTGGDHLVTFLFIAANSCSDILVRY